MVKLPQLFTLDFSRYGAKLMQYGAVLYPPLIMTI
jgi:hypothetical protein